MMKLNALYETVSSANIPTAQSLATEVGQDTESSAVRKMREQQLKNDRKQREEQQKLLQPKLRDIDNRFTRMQANNDQTQIQHAQNQEEQDELRQEINDFTRLIPHF